MNHQSQFQFQQAYCQRCGGELDGEAETLKVFPIESKYIWLYCNHCGFNLTGQDAVIQFRIAFELS